MKEGVSVYVLTYEQEWDKVRVTIDSILYQKNVDVEIIISDDGSRKNLHNTIIQYFNENDFKDYVIISSGINTGLVGNVLRALALCKKKYVKGLSPGDYLIGDNTLCLWIEYLKEHNKKWSFSEVCPYKKENGMVNRVLWEEHPRMKEEYKKECDEISRWAYLGEDDIGVGASMLAERNVMLEYLNKLDGRVVYAEDNMYRLMMFDDIVGIYYPKETVMYEIGSGISTSNSNEWNAKISKDWRETNKIMKEIYDVTKDSMQEKILKKKALL